MSASKMRMMRLSQSERNLFVGRYFSAMVWLAVFTSLFMLRSSVNTLSPLLENMLACISA